MYLPIVWVKQFGVGLVHKDDLRVSVDLTLVESLLFCYHGDVSEKIKSNTNNEDKVTVKS